MDSRVESGTVDTGCTYLASMPAMSGLPKALLLPPSSFLDSQPLRLALLAFFLGNVTVLRDVHAHSVDAVGADDVVDPRVHAVDHVLEVRERDLWVAHRALLREGSAQARLGWC